MLYTVMPLERIYSNRTESLILSNQRDNNLEEKTEYKDITLPHGRVYTRRDGENYVVDGIHSTDMKDYLNADYFPGAIINKA